MRAKLFFAVLASVALSAMAVAETRVPARLENMPDSTKVHDLVEPDPKLLAEYLACSDLAAVHVLPSYVARHCADVYLALKLSFLPDVDLASFQEMTFERRWDAEKLGYAALRKWKEANKLVTPSD